MAEGGSSLEAGYAAAVIGYKQERDPAFIPPRLMVKESPRYGYVIDHDDYRMRVNPRTVGVDDDLDWLTTWFMDRFDEFYMGVVEQELAAVAAAFGYEDDLGVELAFSDRTDQDGNSADEVCARYDLETNTLVMDAGIRPMVDPGAGAVSDVAADWLRQQVAHLMLHGDKLYDEEGLQEQEISFDGEAVATREQAEALYDAAVESFRADYDDGFEPPELVFEEGSVAMDHEDETVTVDPGVLSVLDSSAFTDDLVLLFKTLYDEALHDAMNPAVAWLQQLYAEYDPDIEISEAFFAELGEGTAANYTRTRKRVKVDTKYMDAFDWRTATFSEMKPDSTCIHEAEHGRDYQNNPLATRYKTDRKDDEELYGEKRSYKEDIRNATLEMKTTFVQWLYGYTGRSHVHDAIEDPWTLPEFFQGYTDLHGPRQKKTVRDPYSLGLFTARSVHDGFINTYGAEKGEELTLDFLYNMVLPPEGMQGALENSFDLRNQPNYPRMLRETYEQLQEREEVRPFVTEESRRLRKSCVTARTETEALESYLEASALINAYTAAENDELPSHLAQLQLLTRWLHTRYHVKGDLINQVKTFLDSDTETGMIDRFKALFRPY